MSNIKQDSKNIKNEFTNKKRNKDSEEKSINNTTAQIANNIIDNDTDDDNKEDDIDDLFDEEGKIGEIEYTKNLIKALKEAIEENDKLRQYALELTKENEDLKKEMSEKDDVIRELAQYYQVRYYILFFL